jgi:2-polyprenyl-6-methoxyphenol hydroxylase-like FAD-dependent oxidoreductase
MAGADRDAEVIVVGAGPVGLCLSVLLAERGVSVIVLEANDAIEEDLRASTFHPPTMDMLDWIGVTPVLLDQGLICPNWQVRWHPKGERAVFDLSILSDITRHPYRLQVEQWKLSKALLELAQKSPHIDLRFATAATNVYQTDGNAEVEIDKDEKHLRARYVVGCDGSRSVVRKSVDLPFEGVTYPETTLLATTTFPFEEHLEGLSNVTYCWKDGGQFSLLKVPGRWRASIYPREDISIEDQMTPEALEASFQEIVSKPEPYEINDQRPYRVHMRIVPSYRIGRVFVAGDAAHLKRRHP